MLDTVICLLVALLLGSPFTYYYFHDYLERRSRRRKLSLANTWAEKIR